MTRRHGPKHAAIITRAYSSHPRRNKPGREEFLRDLATPSIETQRSGLRGWGQGLNLSLLVI